MLLFAARRPAPYICALLLAFTRLLTAAQPSAAPAYFKTGTLSFEDRVWAQTQIERVYYSHRIWPKENPGPKPPFEVMVPDTVIRTRAAEALQASAALAQRWNNPLDAEQLDAELARMRKDSRDPKMLRELFAALQNDRFLIAETLARQTLATRELRARYDADANLHAAERAEAEQLFRRAAIERSWAGLPGYARQTFLRRAETGETPAVDGLPLDGGEFSALQTRLPAVSATPSSVENPEGFVITRTLAVTADSLTIETLQIAKRPFELWWNEVQADYESAARVPVYRAGFVNTPLLELPAAGGCDSWATMAPFADQAAKSSPAGRYFHSAVWTGSEMIIWGGAASVIYGDGSRYTPATDSWNAMSATGAPSARYLHTATWSGSEMIVWGGIQGGGGPYFNTGARYSPGFDNWTVMTTTNAPSARAYHTAVWTGSVMVVWGGSTYLCPSTCTRTAFNSGGRYTPGASDSWTATALPAPTGRDMHTAVWAGAAGVMIVWGGQDLTYNLLNTGGRYNPGADSWTPTSIGANVPAGRDMHTAVWTGAVMVIWGGSASGAVHSNTGGRYDPLGDAWTATSIAAGVPNGRNNHAAVWTGSQMVVWGGQDTSYSEVNTGGRYDPAGDGWIATSTATGAAFRRQQATVVWSGTEMIVWGGQYNSSNYLNDGGRYNPGTDSWAPVAVYDGINGRSAHSAIWTGAEMIIWGGYGANAGNTQRKNSGGRYNPATDSWTPTSISGAPSARAGHAAVWSGTEMILWGTDSIDLTGGRYNPSTNSWLATATSGAGAPIYQRFGPTAVWSGTAAVFWGGSGFNGSATTSLNSGFRYYPASDSWSPTSMIGVPQARQNHTGIWTGGEMVVWGGYDRGPTGSGNTALNSGGRYDPVGDSWVATSTGGNVPSIRYLHTAVWSGTQMIVWSGLDFTTGTLQNGGRLNLPANTWSTLNVTNAPALRQYPTAVFSGKDMLVWGGSLNAGGYGNTGGRYNPGGDAWTATSTGANLPAGRTGHSAVFTDHAMIVWGGNTGSPNTANFNSGGIYLYGPDGAANTVRGGKSATINLTWTAPSGANSYNVKRCAFTTAPCTPASIVGSPVTASYSEAADANSYMYAIESVNACGTTP